MCTPLFEGWFDAAQLNILGAFVSQWKNYISTLNYSHVRPRDIEDSLCWIHSPFGDYTPKSRYLHIISARRPEVQVWWWKTIWKFICLEKATLLLWCLFENKIPIWENLQKRQKEGFGWCTLCKNVNKIVTHMFMSFSFTLGVWVVCRNQIGFKIIWHNDFFFNPGNYDGNM